MPGFIEPLHSLPAWSDAVFSVLSLSLLLVVATRVFREDG